MKRVLILGYVWPEPNSSAAGRRMLELITLFKAMDCEVHFASAATISEHRADLISLEVVEQVIALNCSSFDEYVTQYQPDLVLFDRFFMEEQFGWRVEKACPQALRILDTEDLHSLRDARHQLLKRAQKLHQTAQKKSTFVPSVSPVMASEDQLYHEMSNSDMALREVAAIFRCDLSLLISEFEMTFLQRYFAVPKQQLFYCPLLVPNDLPSKITRRYGERKHFISIGNFRHQPNWDSVLWLKHELWPKIRSELLNVELHIYGAYPPPKATELHNPKEGFYIKGWVDDAAVAMISARVCLAPLRFGAGIKGKLIEAMVCGTPSVTTCIGEEGMSGNLPWGGVVANTGDSFAAAAIAIYNDESLWQEKQQSGFAILHDHFAKKDYAAELKETLIELASNLPEARTKNFIGRMLLHHQLKSTQYMGQWIEAKNKNSQ